MAIRYGRGDVKQTTTGFRDPRHHICQKQIPIPIRFEGFETLFQTYPLAKVERLMEYVRPNGGISRYKKIRYFYEEILQEPLSKSKCNAVAMDYSRIVKNKIIKAPFVKGALRFFEENKNSYNFSIISGSDQKELQDICREKKIDKYFCEILGSPTEKNENLSNFLERKGLEKRKCLYIGDSINDYNAAKENELSFLGRQSGLIDWKEIPETDYIENLSCLTEYLT